MTKTLLFTSLLLVAIAAAAQSPRSDSMRIASRYTKLEEMITMRDGVKLFTAIYNPKDESEKHPVLLLRTPYSCAPYGEGIAARFFTRGDSMYVNRNYIMVIQDVRGRFMSEGDFEDVRPFIPGKESMKGKTRQTTTDEASDTYDTIDWLMKHVKSNNGRVGVYGISYPGFYATMAAASNHPALKAVSPQAPVTDWFIGDDFHHNGVPFLMDAFDFFRGFGVPRPQPLKEYPPVPELKRNDNYSFFLNAGTFRELKEKYMGDSIRFFNDVSAHPNYDEWWKARDARKACVDLKPAMLVVGGLFDAEDCWGGWNLYKAIQKQSPSTNCKIVYGPWWHGGWARSAGRHLGNVWFEKLTSSWYQKNIELPFFEYHLKGKGSGDEISEATVFFTGENEWKELDQWPPHYMSVTALYLHGNDQATFTRPVTEEGFDEYVSDPWKPVPYTEDVHSQRTREYMSEDQRFASRRPDVLVYQTEILTEEVTLAGPVMADLFVSLSTSDADFVVKLIDVFPEDFNYPDSVKIDYPMGGYQMLVRGDIMRGRYRNSFSVPEPFTPGEITNIKFELPDVAHTFLKGHRIMIQIQSTWYPLADRNPQQFIDAYQCTSDDLKKCEIKVYREADHPSRILLPVLK
jgi:hypothetical protein